MARKFFRRNTRKKSFITGDPVATWGSVGRFSREVDVPNDYEGYSSDLYESSSIVFAAVQSVAKPLSEISFVWQSIENGRGTKLFTDKDLEPVQHPWDGATSSTMVWLMVQDWVLAGNSYFVRDKRENGKLRRLRPDWVQIILNRPMEEATLINIVGYKYTPGGSTALGGESTLYSADEVAHFFMTPDPKCMFRGMSPLTPIIEEIQSDKLATKHKGKFFKNAATPPIQIKHPERLDSEEYREFVRDIMANQTGESGAYNPLILTGGADAKVLGTDLKQLDFRSIQGMSETRIAAALGTFPTLIPSSEGMQGSQLTSGNARVVKDIFIDMTLRPMLKAMCDALDNVLDKPRGVNRLWYDDRDVSFFKADRKELAEIAGEESQIMTRLVREGWDADSIVATLKAMGSTLPVDDLVHSGLFSVQLWPPAELGATEQGDNPLARRSVNPNPGTADEATSIARKPPKTRPRSTQAPSEGESS